MNPPGTLRDDFAAQREFVRSRSPIYARLLEILEAQLEPERDGGLQARLAEVWKGRRWGAFYERPLLLLGALRDDALAEGTAHPLWRAIVNADPHPDAVGEAAVIEALARDRTRLWRNLAKRHLQTNEPTRAVAWLWPARIAADVQPHRSLSLVDVGASAGLNLIADRLPPLWERHDGRSLDVESKAPVASRIGFDPRPLDILREEDARWLRACVWPGQRDREVRLEQAIEAFRAMQSHPDAPRLRVATAGQVPAALPRGEDGQMVLVYQTIVRDYLPPSEWESYRAALLDWLQARPRGSALWVELEVTEQARTGGPPAVITAHVRSEDGLRSLDLAHCEPHPRHLNVDESAVAELVGTLGG